MVRRERVRATFQQLRVFEAVVRQQSVSRAAQELFLTQPTVSLTLRELATAVGLPLIAGHGKAFALTPAGELVLESARAQLAQWQTFEDRLAGLKGLVNGRLRIAAVTTTEYFLPGLVGPFALAHPGLAISLSVENRDRVVARLASHADDVAVMMYPPEALAYSATPFMANPLVAIAPFNHRLTAKRSVMLSVFAREPFLSREVGSGTRRAVEEHFAAHGLSLSARMQLGSNEAIKHAVAAGLGVSVLSQHTLSAQPEREGLAVLRVQTLPIRRQWSLVYNPASVSTPAVAAFMAHVANTQK
jgi:LysR family transcriptional regulator, low CO2-responsive transcriptional regulator